MSRAQSATRAGIGYGSGPRASARPPGGAAGAGERRSLLLRVTDAMIVLGLISLSILPYQTALSLIWLAALLPLLVHWRSLPVRAVDPLAAGLLLGLFALLAISWWVHPVPADAAITDPAAFPTFWIICAIFGLTLLARAALFGDTARLLQVWIPVGLAVAFAVLSVERFTPLFGDAGWCRVKGRADTSFNAALVFSCFTYLYLALWPRLQGADRAIAMGLVSAMVVVVLFYTVSRSVLIGTGVAGLVVLAGFATARPPRWTRAAGGFAGAYLAGILISLGLIQLAPCAAYKSVGMLGQVLAGGEIPADATSINIRLVFWAIGAETWAQAPLLGSGRWSEIAAMEAFPHDHVHQQYLAWLIWFGLPGLLAGLAFLAFPLPAVLSGTRGASRWILVAALLCLPLALFFDTFLRMPAFIGLHIGLGCLMLGLSRGGARPRGPDLSTDLPDPPSGDKILTQS